MRVSLFKVFEEETRVLPEEWEVAAAREERGPWLVWVGQGQN
jgi:hypothetical protein